MYILGLNSSVVCHSLICDKCALLYVLLVYHTNFLLLYDVIPKLVGALLGLLFALLYLYESSLFYSRYNDSVWINCRILGFSCFVGSNVFLLFIGKVGIDVIPLKKFTITRFGFFS